MNKHAISFLLNGPPSTAAADEPADAAAAGAAVAASPAVAPAGAPAATPWALGPVDNHCGGTFKKSWSPEAVSDWASCIPSPVASEARPDPPSGGRLPPPPPLTLAPLAAAPSTDALTFYPQAAGMWLPMLPAPLASMAVAGDVPLFVPRMVGGGWAPLYNALAPTPLVTSGTGVPAGSLSTSSSIGGGSTSLVSAAPSAKVEPVSSASGDRVATATPIAPAPTAPTPAAAPTEPSSTTATTAPAAATGPSAGRVGAHQCPSCSVSFRRLGDLRKHLSCVHAFPRRHACEHCGRRFGERSNLTKHVAALHLKRRDAVCKQCNKAFAFSDGLARHVRLVHGGERRYACGECGGRFKQRTHLQKHARVHAREKHLVGVHKVARPPVAPKVKAT